jgi:hypothetical protein
MRNAKGLALIASVALAVSCGGPSSDDGGLQQADAEQVAATLGGAMDSVSATPTNAAAGDAPRAATEWATSADLVNAFTSKAVLNFTTNCPAGGHVTTRGNFFVSCPTPPATGACTFSGAATINFGDATNNLNDCAYENGLIVDGGLNLMISGSGTAASVTLTETLVGGLSLNRKGPTGGLVPISINGIGVCMILLTAKLPERTITGSVCGLSVNRTF